MKTEFKRGDLLVRSDSEQDLIYKVEYSTKEPELIGYLKLITPKGFQSTTAVRPLKPRLKRLRPPLRAIRSNELFWYSQKLLRSKWE